MSFTVFRSSAGSGKTFTLVKEYLKIILKNPFEFNHVLAITFTNKAAAEMKERILQALQALSPGNEGRDNSVVLHLLPQLTAETGLSAEEVAQGASRALELILHHYSDFAIGTIDAFSHRIIRSFAFDFGLPVQFNVELEIEDLLIAVVDLLLDRVGNDEALTRFGRQLDTQNLVRFKQVKALGLDVERDDGARAQVVQRCIANDVHDADGFGAQGQHATSQRLLQQRHQCRPCCCAGRR